MSVVQEINLAWPKWNLTGAPRERQRVKLYSNYFIVYCAPWTNTVCWWHTPFIQTLTDVKWNWGHWKWGQVLFGCTDACEIATCTPSNTNWTDETLTVLYSSYLPSVLVVHLNLQVHTIHVTSQFLFSLYMQFIICVWKLDYDWQYSPTPPPMSLATPQLFLGKSIKFCYRYLLCLPRSRSVLKPCHSVDG